jgi:predicted AAA+ superfamily ATPase
MTASAPSSFQPRHLATAVVEALEDTPVVCILGPRQSGKSTLARHCDPERAYYSLDQREYFELAGSDPEGFIDQLPDRVTIDEIQRVPELTLAIKRSVDAKRLPGRFLLTGSANLLQLPRLADSLAGRMECVYLQPFTEAEKECSAGQFIRAWMAGEFHTTLPPSSAPTPSELPARLVAGGFPDACFRPPRRARRWQAEYVASIIERDIRDIADVQNAADLSRLLEFVANQTATLLNVAATANALGHTRRTIERHLGLLEKLFLVRQLPAWHSNRNKRLVKTPKVHICDSGLCATLADLRAEQWNEERTRFGRLLESFVVQQMVALSASLESPPRMFHYRDKDQVEVDLVMEFGRKVWGIEVKAASNLQSSDGKGLRRLQESSKERFQGGIILYTGAAILPIDPELNLYAVPLSKLWEL